MQEWLPFAVVFAAWFGGGAVSVITGFGCGLFAMPIMLLVLPTEIAIPVNCVLCCVAMLLILVKFWRAVDWRHFWIMSIAALPGAFVGVYALERIPVGHVELGFGIFLLAVVGWELLRGRIGRMQRRAPGPVLEIILAFVAGVINGLTGMGGPAMGAYAALTRWDKDMTRGTFGLFFGLNLTLCTVLQYRSGMIGAVELELIGWAVPGAVLGTLAGIPVAGRLRQDVFMKLLLLVIGISGIVVIGKQFVSA